MNGFLAASTPSTLIRINLALRKCWVVFLLLIGIFSHCCAMEGTDEEFVILGGSSPTVTRSEAAQTMEIVTEYDAELRLRGKATTSSALHTRGRQLACVDDEQRSREKAQRRAAKYGCLGFRVVFVELMRAVFPSSTEPLEHEHHD